MNKKIFVPTEPHSGQCSHCRSEVPIDATTCSGCGAYWGFNDGMSRNELYHSSDDKFKSGIIYILLMTAFWLIAAFGHQIMAVPFLFGLLFSFHFVIGGLIAGFFSRRRAKRTGDGEIDWYLKK